MSDNRADIMNFLRDSVSEISGKPVSDDGDILESRQLIADLGLDSLDLINLLFSIEEKYGLKIPEEDIDSHDLVQFGKLVDYVADRVGPASATSDPV